MADRIKITQKVIEVTGKIEETLLLKLLEEEPTFTGKFSVEVNCNQGGITGVAIYLLRKIG
jgi:hypothetical protein